MCAWDICPSKRLRQISECQSLSILLHYEVHNHQSISISKYIAHPSFSTYHCNYFNDDGHVGGRGVVGDTLYVRDQYRQDTEEHD